MDESLDLMNSQTNCKPLAWVLIDRTTDELVSICLIEPKEGWLSECYEVVPLYAFREVKKPCETGAQCVGGKCQECEEENDRP